mmetsp:Transcript_26851/g.104222  ORF Transcript_26851/g.104222 Transcript_26851/m.104222 type:complete len:350 (-) Transcript_26851:392-1441(-)
MYSFEGLGFVNPAVKPVRASPATGKSCSRYRVLTRVSTPTAPQGPPDLSNLKAGIARPERYTSSDWARNLTNLPRSAVLRRIQSHLLWNIFMAAAVGLAHEVNQDFVLFHLSTLPHMLLGTAASLLLVFRTNSAYDRFWEGRKLWGTLINRCRNLASLAVTNMEDPTRVVPLTAAFAYLLGQHLQGEVRMSTMPIKLQDNELREIGKGGNVPYRVAAMLREEIRGVGNKGEFPASAVRVSMEEDITTLVDVMGACERIVKTPVPLAYSRHTSRFLSVYAFTLPLILVDKEGLMVVFSVLMITWALFGIEEIGHMIEDPFTPKSFSLPLRDYAVTIHTSLEELVGHKLTE